MKNPFKPNLAVEALISMFRASAYSSSGLLLAIPSGPRHSPGQKFSQPKLRKLCRARGMTVRQYKGL